MSRDADRQPLENFKNYDPPTSSGTEGRIEELGDKCA